jgi:hypothetical protein
MLSEEGADIKGIQGEMYAEPKYDTRNRKRTKYTEAVDSRLREILEEEEKKTRRLGIRHKQRLTNKQIHAIIAREGHDISRPTINIEVGKLRKRLREVYIHQEYDPGDRLEYDFGEVKLDCGLGNKTYHMAVFTVAGGEKPIRWAYLYTNEKQGVFMDSHVKFFEMCGGVWREVVYDNMRNVVRKFIGRNEKELNAELVKMATYYGYQINVTNCFKGNEKGSVETSVKVLRNEVFAEKTKFNSLEDAQEYLQSRLIKLNDMDRMEEEKRHLLPYKPPLELAVISENTVNPYSFICVDTAFYSVPEYFVGKKVIVKKYHDEIRVYAGNELICKHKRVFGNGKMSVDIYHYLDTLLKKPGAIRNSVALKRIPRLKAIFDTFYASQPKKFIEIFLKNKELPVNEIIALFEEKTQNKAETPALDVVRPASAMEITARTNMQSYIHLINVGLALHSAPRLGVSTHGDTGISVILKADVHTG